MAAMPTFLQSKENESINDLFKIAMEVDRFLKDGGTLIIKDFYPSFHYKNNYSHLEGLYSYKMNYVTIFTWNPTYTEIAKELSSHSVLDFKNILMRE